MKKFPHPFFKLICIILLFGTVIFSAGHLFGKPDQKKDDKMNNDSILSAKFGTEESVSACPTDSKPVSTAPTVAAQPIKVRIQKGKSGVKSTKGQSAISKAQKSSSSALSGEPTSLSRKALQKLPAGTVIDSKKLGDKIMDTGFYYKEISEEVKNRIIGKSYKEDCTVPFDSLRYVRVLYYGFDNQTHIGELIVNAKIADDITAIFSELYKEKYAIEQMVLIDEYDADDNASMAANNTSSFNYRLVPGSKHLSKHAMGLAIDINPLYNPYIQYNKNKTVILPKEGIPYADRTLDCPYYIDEKDLCYQTFTKHGFTWGGSWDNEPDYQHFQKSIK